MLDDALDALRDEDDFDFVDSDLHPARILFYAIAVAAAPAIIEQASQGVVRIVRAVAESVRRAKLPKAPAPEKKKGARRPITK